MELQEYQSYQQYKEAVDTELQRSAESFVRIGYLLKVARDTDILQESGYTNVNEFAKGEYGIERTQVSRFININDRFSEGGFSDKLLPEYQGMGYAKLALMLTLPDSINQELTPEYTKTEIQAVKEEVEAEHQKTDLEVMMEGLNPDIEKIESDLDKAIYQLIHDNPDLLVEYIEISASAERIGMPIGDVDIYEMLAPNEQAMYSTRLQGIGRMFLSIKDQEHITLTNVRTNEKQTYFVQEARDCLKKMIGNMTGSRTEDIWMALFNEEFPVKEEPKAPETAKTLNAKPISEPKKSKVTKAPEKSAPKNEKPAKTLNAEAHKNEMENNAPKDIGQQPDQEAVGQQDTEETTEEAKGQQDSVCTGATISGEPVPATVENTDYEDKAAALARDISYFVANRKWTDVKYAADELAQTASMLMMTKEDN